MDALLLLQIIHGLVGGAAILAAVVAAMATKGSPAHVRAGRLYARILLADVALTTPVFLWSGDLFLMVLGLTALVLGWSGQREIERRRDGSGPSSMDRTVLIGVLLGALGLFAAGSSAFGKDGITGSIIFLIGFAFGTFILAASEWHRLHSASSEPTVWATQHVSAMSGSVGALTTSVAVLVLHEAPLPVWFVWLAPSIAAAAFATMGITRIRLGHLPKDPAPPKT